MDKKLIMLREYIQSTLKYKTEEGWRVHRLKCCWKKRGYFGTEIVGLTHFICIFVLLSLSLSLSLCISLCVWMHIFASVWTGGGIPVV